jgi:hypothetical protein
MTWNVWEAEEFLEPETINFVHLKELSTDSNHSYHFISRMVTKDVVWRFSYSGAHLHR